MSTTHPKVEAALAGLHSLQERKYFAHPQRKEFKPLRGVKFIQRLEQFERIRVRFAAHVERERFALASPVTQYFMLEAA